MVSSGSPDYRDSGLVFPRDFVIGSATASYQIEGAVQEDGRGPSIWDTFSHTPGRVVNGDTGDVADDHYHRLDADLDLMASLGLEAYRFSIAWTRIQATGSGKSNEKGLAFYGRLVDGLLERGIRPVATLYHWDLPQALEDAGGWVNRDTALRFTEYAALTVEALGDRVHTWTTFNEPWCSAYLGYGSGAHAPGRTDGAAALAAVHHLNLAHGLAVPEIRRAARNEPDVSITLNFHVIRTPEDATPDDRADDAKRRIDALANRAFLSPLLRGRYDDDLLTDTAGVTDWAFLRPGDEESIHQPIDMLGVNYYSTVTVKMWDGVSPRSNADGHKDTGGSPWPGSGDVEFVEQPGPYTEMGWNIAPDGLEELLVSLHEQFPQQALAVTENGAAFADQVVETEAGKRVPDADRVDYLNRHFTAAHRAIARGVPLHGYFVWSLLDNFEWAWGYTKRFGIVRVDYETQERIVKDSGLWLQKLIETRATPD
jgi:beta-glucosidase